MGEMNFGFTVHFSNAPFSTSDLISFFINCLCTSENFGLGIYVFKGSELNDTGTPSFTHCSTCSLQSILRQASICDLSRLSKFTDMV